MINTRHNKIEEGFLRNVLSWTKQYFIQSLKITPLNITCTNLNNT